MEDHSLKDIRRESIKKIFSCICEKKQISRLEISDKTGLSLMTVGKITDQLFERGIIVYEKSDSSNVGRKAKQISLAENLHVLVSELSRGTLTASFYDIALNEKLSFEYKRDTKGADLESGFFGELMPFIFENGLVGTLVGVGVAYDDDADKELAESLADSCKATLSLTASYVSDTLDAKVRAASKGKRVLYFIKNGTGVLGALYNGTVERGQIRCNDERELDISLSAVCDFLSPDAIYLEFENAPTLGSAVTVDTKKASLLTRIGIADAVREAYLLS